MSEVEILPPLPKAEDGGQSDRAPNGRFKPGHKLAGPGNAGARINIPQLAKRKAAELGLDLDSLLWDVVMAMLLNGACGDTKAAKLAYDMLGEQAPKGPLIAIDATTRLPEAPPLEGGSNGAPALGDHLSRLVAIAKERGLADLSDMHPAKVIEQIAQKNAVDELLS